jgi:polyisoprenoid-binding protein YceI
VSNRLLLVIGGIALLVVLAVGGVFAYQFFTPNGSSSSSSSNALSTPSSSPKPGGLPGTWAVTAGSSAGYRATEQFVGQTGPNKAIAVSPDVTGVMTISDSGGQLTAQQFKVTVDMLELKSSDPAATHGNFQRDNYMRTNGLETVKFPDASYEVDSIVLPGGTAGGGTQQLSTKGKLMIHGTSKDVSIPMMGQLNSDKIEVTGSVDVDMNDYSIKPPSVPFTSAQPQVTIAFHLFFAKR